jgi:hypothetical protein
MYRLASALLVSLCFLNFIGCADDVIPNDKVAIEGLTYTGSKVHIYGGEAYTWIRVKIGADTTPLALGITLNQAMMNSLDRAASSMNPLPLPGIATKYTPFDHVSVDWNPMGHPPAGTYDVPHFDFHFYTITTTEQMMIGDDSAEMVRMPDSSLIPPFYTATGSGVPKMGWHWFDSRSPEYNGGSFTKTLVYGYNGGHLAFVEPMITEATLLSHQTLAASIPQPSVWEKKGVYDPISYKISYDAENQLYIVQFDGWVKH